MEEFGDAYGKGPREELTSRIGRRSSRPMKGICTIVEYLRSLSPQRRVIQTFA